MVAGTKIPGVDALEFPTGIRKDGCFYSNSYQN
jgi:hypothetical protein